MRALAPALAAALAGGCAILDPIPPTPPAYEGFPLERFYRVDDGLFAGAQPSRAQLAWMADRYDLRTVIKLSPRWQGRDEVPPGVTLIERPIPAVFTPDDADVRAILDDLERAPRPIYLHCRTGADRTGLIVALYRLRHGATVADAEAEMLAHGFRRYRGIALVWERAAAAVRERELGRAQASVQPGASGSVK